MVKCEICGEKLKRITNIHLQKHKTSCKEYKRLFPNSKTVSLEASNAISAGHLRKTDNIVEPPGCCIYCKFLVYRETYQRARENRTRRYHLIPKCLKNKFNIEAYFYAGRGVSGAFNEMLRGCPEVKKIFFDNHCEAMRPRHELFVISQILYNVLEQQKNIIRTLTINNLIQPKEDYNAED